MKMEMEMEGCEERESKGGRSYSTVQYGTVWYGVQCTV